MSLSHTLKHDIVVTTRPAGGEAKDETVHARGEAIALRRPKARDLKVMDRFDGREIEGTIHMIAALSGLEIAAVENMDAEDFGALGELLAAFMPDGPPTGATA